MHCCKLILTMSRFVDLQDKTSRDVRSLSPAGNGTGRSRSISPTVDDTVIVPNRVQNFVRAAEQYHCDQTIGKCQGKKRPSLPTNSRLIPQHMERKFSHQDSSPSRNDINCSSASSSPNGWRTNSPPTSQTNCTSSPSPSSNKNNKPVIPTKPDSLAALGRRKPSLPPMSPKPITITPPSPLPTTSPTSESDTKPITITPPSPRPTTSPTSESDTKPITITPPSPLPTTSPTSESDTTVSQSLSPPVSPSSSQSVCPSSSPISQDSSSPIFPPADQERTNNVTMQCQAVDSTSDISSRVLLRTSTERVRRESAQYRESVFSTIYDNNAALTAAELFDSSWSDSDSYKDYSDVDVCERKVNGVDEKGNDKPDPTEENPATGNGEPVDKRFKVASELLKTEKDYVTRLQLIHKTFYTRLEEENKQNQFIPAEVLNHIFAHIQAIYLFHNKFLLPQLESRMQTWKDNPKLGDLMKQNAPFLKMYSEYILNFPQAMELLKEWTVKSSRFANIIQEIQKDPLCGSLSLQHHMLGPIQRVPRYELLLKDYVKHLPEDSPDTKDATEALDLVANAATHSNEARRKIETFQNLLEIYQSLKGVSSDFISPTREFIMQGPITKISARSGEKQPRYLFLFSDLVLICSQYLLSTYNVRCQMQVDNMEIKPGSNMNITNTFMVHSKQKAVEFLDETTTPESPEWEKKIGEVIEAYRRRKRSIKQDSMDPDPDNELPDNHRGKVAPRWIPDDAATMCMLCGTSFNMMRRRHHCRSCGKLVCRSCSSKAPLEYMKGKIERVCSYCYDVIVNKIHECSSESSVSTPSNGNSPKKKGSVKVKASDPSLIASYLQWSEDKGKTWQRLWVTAHTDFVLYSFRKHEDVQSVSVVPLPGYVVETSTSDPCWFALRHKKKYYQFQAENELNKKRWTAILEKLVKVEFPDESLRHSIKSDCSGNSSSSDPTTALCVDDMEENIMDTLDTNGDDEKAEERSLYDNVDP